VVSPGHTKGGRLRFLGFSTRPRSVCRASGVAPPLPPYPISCPSVGRSYERARGRVGFDGRRCCLPVWGVWGRVRGHWGVCLCACVPVSPLSVGGLTVGGHRLPIGGSIWRCLQPSFGFVLEAAGVSSDGGRGVGCPMRWALGVWRCATSLGHRAMGGRIGAMAVPWGGWRCGAGGSLTVLAYGGRSDGA